MNADETQTDFRRGALGLVFTPARCSARDTAPCESPWFFSSSAIVAPASYCRFIAAASSSLTFRLLMGAPSSRSIRVNAEFATPSSRASDRTLLPARVRSTRRSTFSARRVVVRARAADTTWLGSNHRPCCQKPRDSAVPRG